MVAAAANVGLSALAITDHDTVSAITTALPEASRRGIELIAGVEWTAVLEGREIHLLGYFLDVDDPLVVATCAACARANGTTRWDDGETATFGAFC